MEEDQSKEHNSPTSLFILNERKYLNSSQNETYNDLSYRILHPNVLKNRKSNTFKTAKSLTDIVDYDNNELHERNESLESYYQVKADSIIKLKNSTRKLLYILEEIQCKTYPQASKQTEYLPLDNLRKSRALTNRRSAYSITTLNCGALRNLEYQANNIDSIYIQEEDKDCSIYNKLTRKCHCLNQDYYNDLIIHFNEETKYSTSNIGEIIKNIRILKKFLYMGGVYTKNCLLFLNEGLTDCQHTEKAEITQGCAYADICNIFDDHSIVNRCISWPCKNPYFGNSCTQGLTATLLYKLAEIEEGRRYLSFNSKISNDIRKVLRKKAAVLEIDTIDTLNTTLNLLNPPFIKNPHTLSYFYKSNYEGFGHKTINDLVKFRQHMTFEEILTHLDLLKSFSSNDTGKVEMSNHLPIVLILFKNMVMEFNNSELNILVTHILNNIVSKSMVKAKEIKQPINDLQIANTSTEPIKTKNEVAQMPPKKNKISKTMNKHKLSLCTAPKHLNRHQTKPSKPAVAGWEPSCMLNKSLKFSKNLRSTIIVVPIEKISKTS